MVGKHIGSLSDSVRSSGGDQTAHITVSYREGGDEITCIYALNEETVRKLAQKTDWLGRPKNLTGTDQIKWLIKNGCQLDCSDGPAVIVRAADGMTLERYYRDGKMHREDGPAYVCCYADGETDEIHYRAGKFVREDRFATVQRPVPKAPEKADATGWRWESYRF